MNKKLLKPKPGLSVEQTVEIFKKLKPIYEKFDKEQNTRICSTLRTMTRKLLEAFSELKEADYVSQEALDSWKDFSSSPLFYLQPFQKKSIPGLKEKLILEHCIPLKQIIEEIYSTNDINKIKKSIESIKTAWITKKEDKKLNTAGYRFNRCFIIKRQKDKKIREETPDWLKCYNKCGILLKDKNNKTVNY